MSESQLDYKRWARRLAEVSSGLMETHDLSKLLEKTLQEARELTHSDAGTIYRVEETEDGPALRFEVSQNDSLDLPDSSFVLPLDESSLAGWVAVNGETLYVEDAHELPTDTPYTFDESFDREHGYRTRSMLIVPLQTPDGDIEGVLQLINRKRDPELPLSQSEPVTYPRSIGELTGALASIAAAAIQRANLQESLESMIDSMIETLVTALDERDQITTGHSHRLAQLAERTAKAINRANGSTWEGVEIGPDRRERLRYAALLHDIGKIAVPERVLNKQNRLSDERMKAIKHRFQYIRATDQDGDFPEDPLDRINSINRSGFLAKEDREFLDRLRDLRYRDLEKEPMPVLEPEEYKHLSIQKGNLTESERQLMNDHARQTRVILDTVNWTEWLESVPEIAAMHHEKLDGTGYPDGRTEETIPLDARILAVADIYEALTAQDRPYRDPMSPDEAREILEQEAKNGALDPDIVELFFGSEAYKLS